MMMRVLVAAGSKGLAAVSGFLLTVLVTSEMAPEDAGLFLLGITVVLVVSTILRLGVDAPLLRIMSNSPSKKLLINVLLVVGIVSSSIVATVWVFSESIPNIIEKPRFSIILPLVLYTIPFVALYNVLAVAFQSRGNVFLTTVFQNLGISLLFIISIFIIIPKGSGLYSYALIYFLSAVVLLFLGLLIWSILHGWDMSGEVEDITAGSAHMLMATFMSLAVQWSGMFWAAKYATAADIAFYSVAHRTAMLVGFILLVFNMVYAPVFARKWASKDIRELARITRLSTRVMVLCVFPVVLLSWIYSVEIMSMFGAGYEAAANMFSILILGQFVNVSTGMVATLLYMSGHEKYYRNITFIVGIVTIAIGYLAAKDLGILGCAISTAFGVTIQNLMAFYIVKKRLGFWAL